MPKLFISHSSLDKTFVRRLTNNLRKRNVRTWVDERQIKVGQPIPRRIQEGISQCDFFLIVVSEASVRSKWVEQELNSAYFAAVSNRRDSILPVLVDNVELPKAIRHLKFADFRDSFATGLKELLNTFDINEEAIEFLSRAERLARIRTLLSETDEHGEMPSEIISLVEDETYLPIFEQHLSPCTERLVLLNSLDAITLLADYACDWREIKSHTSIRPLTALYRDTDDWEVRRKAVAALTEIDSNATLDFLIDVLAESPPRVKEELLSRWQELREWKDRSRWIHRIVKLLHQFTELPQIECLYFDELCSEEVDFRYWVFRCLGNLRYKRSIKYIDRFLLSHSWPLATLAEAAGARWYITNEPKHLAVLRRAVRCKVTGLAESVVKEIEEKQRSCGSSGRAPNGR